jgi:Raf kinase inhibitor-like YbhB/YbcL family protein
MKGLAPALAIAALAGCSDTDDRAGKTEPPATLALTSAAFGDGQPIPAQYSCDGADRSPTLSWSDPPKRTKSFALTVDDPDAPGGLFRHWGAFDIPATARSIGEGQTLGVQAINDSGKSGYGGPCPPPGHGPHHYRFTLYALDVERLGLGADTKVERIESEARNHAVAKGELVGTYERR